MRNFLQPARALHCLGCGDPGGVVCGRCFAEDPWAPTKLLIENGVEVRRDVWDYEASGWPTNYATKEQKDIDHQPGSIGAN